MDKRVFRITLFVLFATILCFSLQTTSDCNIHDDVNDYTQINDDPIRDYSTSWYTDSECTNLSIKMNDMSSVIFDGVSSDWPYYLECQDKSMTPKFYVDELYNSVWDITWDGEYIYFMILILDAPEMIGTPPTNTWDTGFAIYVALKFPDNSEHMYSFIVSNSTTGIIDINDFNDGGYQAGMVYPHMESRLLLPDGVQVGDDLGITVFYTDTYSMIQDSFPMYYNGNTGPDSSYGEWFQLHLLGDVEAPTITVQSPVSTGETNYGSTNSISIDWTASDNYELDHFDILVDDTPVVTGLSGTTRDYELADVDEGTHNVTVVAYDTYGNSASSSFWHVEDNTGPDVNILAPTTNANISTSTFTLSWSSSDALTWVSSFDIYDGLSLIASNLSGSTDSYELILDDGLHELHVIGFDTVGNSGEGAVTVRVDTAPPIVSFTSPTSMTYHGSSDVTVIWTVNDPTPSSSVLWTRVYLNGLLNQTYEGTLTQVSWFLSEGFYSVRVEVEDYAGNIGNTTLEFFIDLSPPTVELLNPPSNLLLSNSSITLNLRWSVDENYVVDRIEVWIGTTKYDLGADIRAYTLPTIASTTSVTVKVFDMAGHEGQDSVTITFSSIDSTPPSLSITSPSNSTYSQSSLTISWSATDPESEIEYYEVRVDNAIVVSTTTSIDSYFLPPLSDGAHSVSIRVRNSVDLWRNRTITIFFDTVSPQIEILSPLNGYVFETGSFSLLWDADDAAGVCGELDHFIIYLDGLQMTETEDSTYAFSNLDEGVHRLRVVAFDKAGNSADDQIEVIVDSTPPSISIVTPAESFEIKPGFVDTIQLVCIVTDAVGTENVSVLITSTSASYSVTIPLVFNQVTGTWTASWHLSDVPLGAYILTFVAYDIGNHQGISMVQGSLIALSPAEAIMQFLASPWVTIPTGIIGLVAIVKKGPDLVLHLRVGSAVKKYHKGLMNLRQFCKDTGMTAPDAAKYLKKENIEIIDEQDIEFLKEQRASAGAKD